MAPGAGALCLFLLCLPSVINGETNQPKRLPRASVSNVHYYYSKPSSRHSYPGSQGHSGTGKHVTRAPHTVHIHHTAAPHRDPGVHSYPASGGGSGSGHKPPYQQGIGTHSYPASVGGSGSGYKPPYQQGTRTHSYPASGGGSGSGYKPPYQQGTGTHSYPASGGGSGSGYKPPYQQGTGTHSYPASGGGSGSGYKPPYQQGTGTHSYPPSVGGSGNYNIFSKLPTPAQGIGVYPHPTRYPGNTGYNSHVFIRNQQTNTRTTNYHTTNVYNYHYRPPTVISYSGLGAHHGYYPAYTGVLPNYVYEYRASRSRYRYLLTGLALYNFGMLSQNSQSYNYHKSYTPNINEICKFGVRQYEGTSEEVDIDCRLITHFMWSERNQPLIHEQMTTEVFNALDPKFYGVPIQIRPRMKCYIKWRDSFTLPITRVKEVDCGLLQTYVDRSFNKATKSTTTFLVVVTSFLVLLLG